MKRKLAVGLAFAMMLTMLFSVSALAASNPIVYYDENGNEITVNGMYYNSQGQPMYNASCYYLDADDNQVYVGGCRAYYYDADGNLVAGNYYYDADGNAVSRPSSYNGGWGCGRYYYNAQGNTVNGTFYYDENGNRVTPQSNTSSSRTTTTTTAPSYRGGGGAGGGCCGGRR